MINWIPIDTEHVFATNNSGPWYKGGSWVWDVDNLPIEQRARVIHEILDAMVAKHFYTPLRKATRKEGLGKRECSVIVAFDTKKSGDITLCDQPITHVRYWVQGNMFMGRCGFCTKHVAEKHGSDPTKMHADGQSKPVIGKAGK